MLQKAIQAGNVFDNLTGHRYEGDREELETAIDLALIADWRRMGYRIPDPKLGLDGIQERSGTVSQKDD